MKLNPELKKLVAIVDQMIEDAYQDGFTTACELYQEKIKEEWDKEVKKVK